MAKLIPDDIYENIFLRLDVRNLISCKSVCKSWRSFISGSRFNKAYMKRSYKIGHKRIGEAVFLYIHFPYYIIGSSNSLVCVINNYRELLVANPLTREVKAVPKPFACNFNYEVVSGFGYDSLRDDYKIVFGVMKGKGQTCFHVFSLKSNAWYVTEKVKYTYAEGNSVVGIFCNGAIHWVMHPKNQKSKKVILSFDLSKEEFKEIPQPEYQMENITYLGLSLGIMEECLCIQYSFYGINRVTRDLFLIIRQLWVMKKYNEKQSWVMVDKFKIKHEFFFGYPYGFQVRNDTFMSDLSTKGNIVQSLVSPHLQPDNDDRNDEVSDASDDDDHTIGTLGEEDANSEDDMSLLNANIRKKMTKEERKALIKAGREESVKYQSKAAVKQKKTGGLSNKQKEHKKAMPIAAKRSKIERSKRQKKIKQRGADKQFRGRKAWK